MNKYETLDGLLESLSMNKVPKIWYENWDSSMNVYTDSPMDFITDEYLIYANETFKLNGGIVEAFFEALTIIRDSPSLCQLAFLWHYVILLRGKGIDDLDFSDWPIPTKAMGSHAGMLYAIIIISGLPMIKQFYMDKQIPDNILLDTLSDLEVNMEEYKAKFGVYGLDEMRMGWLLNHLNGALFKLGRLQFIHKVYSESYKVFRNIYSGKVITLTESDIRYGENGHIIGNPITSTGHSFETSVELSEDEWEVKLTKGDGVLDTHIPRGGKMTYNSCIGSFNMAVMFFKKHFPGRKFKAFTCYSWLLSPSLRSVLPEDSNIIKFQKVYYLTSVYKDDSIFDCVFDGKPDDLSMLSTRTSFQRKVKESMLKGNNIDSAGGVMLIEDINVTLRKYFEG